MSTEALISRPPTPQVTVLIADDAEKVRRALGQMLHDDPRFEVVAVASNGDEAAALAALRQPRLAVLDVRMGGGGGPSASARIRDLSPGTVVVALSALDTPSSRRRMAEAGAKAYLVKGSMPEGLLDELWSLAAGD
jgi:DNA-binding NarL/FixJ family response regulator